MCMAMEQFAYFSDEMMEGGTASRRKRKRLNDVVDCEQLAEVGLRKYEGWEE